MRKVEIYDPFHIKKYPVTLIEDGFDHVKFIARTNDGEWWGFTASLLVDGSWQADEGLDGFPK